MVLTTDNQGPVVLWYKEKIEKYRVSVLIITQKPLDRFASNFDWGTRETHRNVLNLVLRF